MPQEMQNEAQQLFSEATENILDQQKVRAAVAQRESAGPALNRQRASLVGLVVAVPVLAVILVGRFTGWSLTSLIEPGPSAPAARREAQDSLDTLVNEIEAFREDYEELPEALAEVAIPARGTWTYARIGDGHFTVRGTLFGQSVNFDSTASAASRATTRTPVTTDP